MSNTSLRRPQKGFRRGGKTAYHGPRQRTFAASTRAEGTSADEKWERTRLAQTIDDNMGFSRYDSGKKREGWMVGIQPTSIEDDRLPHGRAALDCYFLEEDGGHFKATIEYEPYFLVGIKKGHESEVEEWLKRVPGDGIVKTVRRIEKDDLNMPNHLMGYKRPFLELKFANVNDLMAARRDIMPIAERNRKNMNAMDAYAEVATANGNFDIFDDSRDDDRMMNTSLDASDYIVDIREYDVPYHVRVMIDKNLRVGKWYWVEAKHGVTKILPNEERSLPAEPVVMAFDIETTKAPLKFPDAAVDEIMMISYMIDGQGFLITNRQIVSEDISDFDYTPKPEYPGPFMIFNEPDEKAVIERFFLHIKEARPSVIATYNGDFFDWPFVEARASVNGIDMYVEIGWKKDNEDIYKCNYGVHMDCFHWVNRDSYLPQGSRGLKAVTVAKLGYDPDELDPELMTPYASERPQTLAEYSVSDAVATYYLYMKYVHPFIFSLCTILPIGADDTLRKGTGTLCEMLLMVQAYEKNIVLPNKHTAPNEAFWDGHLLDSETYVGGHVESIEAGVFRADIPVDFSVDPGAIDELLNDLDDALTFFITIEEKKKLEDIENYDEVKEQVKARLLDMKKTPNRHERPLIYHLDVASMYPNIMTTNRLQPDSMVDESDCAACDFNRPGKTCDRRLPWSWRGEYIPAKMDEYKMIRNALENERFPGKTVHAPMRTFQELPKDEQSKLIRKRLQLYSQKIYHKIHDSTTITKEAIICQRENPFYVHTVRDFRDRRYDYKGKTKMWKGKADSLKAAGAPANEVEAAKKMIIVNDSLQLAHKVILNSFYGYVMRKGSRWYSLEMAGVTCLTGARIIQMARQLVERLGRPLELDTDGIWCMLPATFPENFGFKLKNGKKLTLSYPCAMLNHLVFRYFTNHQYQTLVDPKKHKYETHSDNTILFEVDGPYKAMILPTSKEEDKNLKKRYAVFNDDGSLAELKGFEVKRRGELKLIKIFQQQIFKFFLEGSDLTQCYQAVAKVANQWLDVLHNKGSTLADEELMDLISENRSMSKTLEEYGAQKSTSITTAKRLADFLGEQMVKDKGLNCKFIICARPRNAPVTERAVPVAIFSAEESVKRTYLKKWLKEEPTDTDPRALLDWDYYLERLGSVIQKLITIPAALQKVRNPVPRVPHPDWLQRRINIKDDKMKQKKLTDLFASSKGPLEDITNLNGAATRSMDDMEDYGNRLLKPKTVGSAVASSQQQQQQQQQQSLTPVAQKRKSPEPPENPDPMAALPKVMPDPSEDYPAFISYQKQKWKIQKEARVRRRQLFGDKRGLAGGNIQQTFMKQAHTTFMNTWQLLHLKSTDSPGVVTAHALIDAKIHTLKVKVPRQVFLNLKSKDLPDVVIEGCEVEQVNYTLPNGHASSHLFKLTVPEEIYFNEAEKFSLLFNHPSVEGVYETQLPLNMRAVLRLGNLCTVDEEQQGVLGRGLEQGFDLAGLKRPSKTRTYLDSCPFAYVYISHITSGERQIFGIFSTTHDQAHIVILQKNRDSGHDLPNVTRFYSEMLAKRAEEAAGTNWQDCFRYQDKVSFKITQVTTRRKAHLEVGDVVKKMRKDQVRPQMLVVQSSQCNQLVHDVPVLGEFPVLPLKYDATDSSLPPLGWQTVVARRLVGHYLGLGSWILHLTALARYGDVPLCNLEREDPRFLIDVAYARRLQANGVVLWWSPGPRPDHAGYERDDLLGPLDTVKLPNVNNPGTFSSVCVDLDVRNLAINTILTSSLINELEGAGADSMSFNPTADGSEILESESAFANAGVVVLREMVKAWWGEACRGSTMADVLVQHLVRWVESPDSFMYDHALHYYVQMMSRKAFQQLMADFRRVGSQVVFASSNRLILQTTKSEVSTAYAYSQYIIKSIKSKPLFHFIDLEIKEYWDYLVWYDEFNHGGRACQQITEPAPGATDGDQPLETIMNWQMATFLPARLQPVFQDWVVEFIELMHGLKRQSADPDSTPRLTQLPPTATDGEERQVLLGKAFEKPLKKAISGLVAQQKREMLHPELAGDYTFPQLPGSHLTTMRNPILELVKMLMQVLSLDRSISMEARLLRKELLAMFDVREFSRDGTFVNPSETLKLSQISCDSCTMTRDLDLCRDNLDPSQSQTQSWRCAHCDAEFDRVVLEERLLATVESWAVQWATQDIKCQRCSTLRVNDLMEHCPCGGEWTCVVDRTGIAKQLAVMKRVAGFYGLRMLTDVVGDLMEDL
ncbi:DNA polymerase epsilon subunit 1 [Geosmithia morbida]|uniref:DNA polymerase epsilon catalytic subunit n=1 Tax=Geosmithia morbida TaxID=1094350 RepID=A0A9P4Z1X4_9HYPO|nr:DNA polymerase epsilon subunit 1 [Geosmithia morbida]KAF4126175.1 DNA polymerase epsilon subunit 1 [Geosmithia morbida]